MWKLQIVLLICAMLLPLATLQQDRDDQTMAVTQQRNALSSIFGYSLIRTMKRGRRTNCGGIQCDTNDSNACCPGYPCGGPLGIQCTIEYPSGATTCYCSNVDNPGRK